MSAGLFSVGVQEYVGLSQSGTFTQTGGTNSVAGGLDLGESGGAGTYTVSGPGLLTTATEVVGYSGTGTFTQTAGTNSTGTLSLAYSAGSSGTYNLTGGKLIASQITQGAGTAQVNFSGGTLQAGGTFSSSVPMTLGGGGGGATVATGGYTMTLSGSLSGSGGLTKTDAGALVLAASNIYSGGTALDDGVLVAANGSEGSATGSGSVTLNGGTLASAAGGGSIQGNVQAGSGDCVIAPGGIGAIGPLSLGSLTTASNLTLNFDLTTPGGSGDLLTITGGLILAPHTAITFGTPPTTVGNYRLIGGNFGTPALERFRSSRGAVRQEVRAVRRRGPGIY